jgi:hypothetical protein
MWWLTHTHVILKPLVRIYSGIIGNAEDVVSDYKAKGKSVL